MESVSTRSVSTLQILFSWFAFAQLVPAVLLSFLFNFLIGYYTTSDDGRLVISGPKCLVLSVMIAGFIAGCIQCLLQTRDFTRWAEKEKAEGMLVFDIDQIVHSSFLFLCFPVRVKNYWLRSLSFGVFGFSTIAAFTIIMLFLACLGKSVCLISRVEYAVFMGGYVSLQVIALFLPIFISSLHHAFFAESETLAYQPV